MSRFVPLGLGLVAGLGLLVMSSSGPAPDPLSEQPGRHFTWAELTRSQTATRYGLDNTPSPEAAQALIALCTYLLDPLREGLNQPLQITSGYRSPQVSARISGAAKNSQHGLGEAVDFKVSGLSAIEVAEKILSLGLPFDQLIAYAPSRGGHVHLSLTLRRPNRQELLWAPGSGGFTALEVA